MWKTTDGCSKQYHCGTAMYFLSLLAFSFNIVIDRAICAPGHGKDIVDELNAVTKCFLQKQFCMIGTPEADNYEKRIKAHSMVETASTSLAEECQMLCASQDHVNRVKRDAKNAKWEKKSKVQECIYHVQD